MKGHGIAYNYAMHAFAQSGRRQIGDLNMEVTVQVMTATTTLIPHGMTRPSVRPSIRTDLIRLRSRRQAGDHGRAEGLIDG